MRAQRMVGKAVVCVAEAHRGVTLTVTRPRYAGPRRYLLGVALTALVSAGIATPTHQASAQALTAQPPKASRVEGVLARPAGQYKVNSSSSSVSTEITWNSCVKPDDCMLSFDFLVDSETLYDQLRVWFDSETTLRFSTSGYEKGHKRLKGIPAGTHTVQFEYFKDASISTGADIAWVDNVMAYDGGGRRHISFCNDVGSVRNVELTKLARDNAQSIVAARLPALPVPGPDSQFAEAFSGWFKHVVCELAHGRMPGK